VQKARFFLAARGLVFAGESFRIDASETLADELVCLEVVDALFGAVSLGWAHLLPLGLSRDGSVPLTAEEPIPEVAQHAESLVAGALEHPHSEIVRAAFCDPTAVV
jgi:hypothetical protein